MMVWACDRCKKQDETITSAITKKPFLTIKLTLSDGSEFSEEWEICAFCFKQMKKAWDEPIEVREGEK